jgi:hypothetical protein
VYTLRLINIENYRYDRKKRYKENNWCVTYAEPLLLWENRPREEEPDDPPYDQTTFDEYLRFLHRLTRT